VLSYKERMILLVSKNLDKYRFESNFVEPSKIIMWNSMMINIAKSIDILAINLSVL